MADPVQLILEQRKTEWEFTAWRGGDLLALAKTEPHGPHVLFHLQVYAWGRELYREYRICFEAIRQFFREDGRELIVIASDRYSEKMGRFWKMMGFECFGEITEQGHRVPFAVMEA